jgi:biotin operon repressor
MGVNVASSSRESQDRRLRIKTLGQRMKQVAVEGAGLSPWEAEVLVDAIAEVYFSDPDLKELSAGQMKYSCVSATEGSGKPLNKCAMSTVLLTMIDPEDRKELPVDGKQASVHRRRRKIMRLTEEAREQGGLLTQEDLAAVLDSDVRTIRRDIHELRENGIVVATRGQQKDIGPGVSHRGLAVRHWLEGKEPVEVARAINHSLGAVENYLEKFKRVAYLREKSFDDFQIALTVGMSVAAVKTFVEIYKESKNRTFFRSRLAEIELVGEQHYLAEDEKKDSGSSNVSSSGGMRK